MLKSLVTLTAACALGVTAPLALADPPGGEPLPDTVPAAAGPAPAPALAPPVDNGAVVSGEPGTLRTRDGWILAVAAKDETQLAVAPL